MRSVQFELEAFAGKIIREKKTTRGLDKIRLDRHASRVSLRSH